MQREGICLYDSKRFTLAKARKLPPSERKRLAQEDFEFWVESANGFYKQFRWGFHEEELSLAAYRLS